MNKRQKKKQKKKFDKLCQTAPKAIKKLMNVLFEDLYGKDWREILAVSKLNENK